MRLGRSGHPLLPAGAALAVLTTIAFPAAPVSAKTASEDPPCAASVALTEASNDVIGGRWRRAAEALDSLRNLPVHDCESATTRLEAELLRGNLLWKTGDVGGGKAVISGVRQDALAATRPSIAVEALAALGEIAYVEAHIMEIATSEDAFDALALALAEAERLQRHDLAAQILGRSGVVLERRGNLEEAAAMYRRALDLARRHDARAMLHLPLTHLASIAEGEADHETAERLYAEALDAARSSPAPEQMAFALVNSASLARRTNRLTPEQALIETYRAHEIATRLDHTIATTLTYVALAVRHRELGDEATTADYFEAAQTIATEHRLTGLARFAASLSQPSG